MSTADRLNRVLLLLLGVLFLAAGAAGLAAAFGAFGTGLEHATLYDNTAGRYVGAHGAWIWPVAAAASVLLAVLSLVWLRRQASSPRAGTISLDNPTGEGSTALRSDAVTDAITAELSGYRGVQDAKVQLLGERGAEHLAVAVEVSNRVELAPLRARIENDAFGRARTALGDPHFPVSLLISVAR